MFPARQSSGNPGRPPQKKALIIGICYRTREVTEDYGHLSAPHSDAEAMCEMLIRHYGYEEHNVTVMLDRKDVMDQTPHLAPTREHILREVANLVSGAQPGDIFVFHFSGHCDQIKCKNGSEDDGLDEALLPMDHQGLKRENLIRDNKLRKLLVNRLPVGAHLTAFLDSCHSGTLLDLDHYACMNGTSPICPRNLRTQHRSRCSKAAARSTGSRIVHSYGVNDHEVQSRESSIMESSSPPGTPRRLSVRTRTSSTHTLANGKTVSMGQVMDTITDVTNLNTPAAEGEPSILHDEGRFILGDKENRRCLSPTPDSPSTVSTCGVSTCFGSPTLRPIVLSISACEDSQMVWDDPNDFSMTKAVIEALEEDRYPTLHDLVEKVANRLRKCATELHKWSQDRQNSYMERERGRQALVLAGDNPPPENAPAIELAAYWKPQIGSTKYMNPTEHRLVL